MVSKVTNVEKVTIPEGYKQTEVGVIPEDWDVISIDHALNTKMILDQMDGNHGELYPKSHEFSDFGIPYVGATDFNNGRVNFSSCKYLPLNRARLFKKGIAKHDDVLFAHNATVGPVSLLDTEFEFVILSTTATYYRPDISQINNKYLASYFESQLFVNQYSSVMSQSTRNQVPILTQRKFKLVLPSIKEQITIANALSDVDNLIASLETLITKKSVIKTAAMQQLLTGKKRLPGFEGESVKESEKQGAKQSSELDNISETAQAAQAKQASTLNSDLYKETSEGLDSKPNQHSEVYNANNKQTAPRPGYKQTELGEIPEDWEVKTLGDLGKFKNGVNKDGDSFGFGQPFVNLMDVFGKTAIKGDEKLGLINSTELDRKEYDLRTGDVLFIRSSVKPSGVGLTAVVLSDLENTIYSGFLIRYRSLAALDLQFKQFCFHEAGFRKRIVAASSVSANTNINQDSLKQLLLAYPSDTKEQTAIANVLSDMDTELDALQQRLSKTQKIKQGMMQELLTGKTRLV